jgi:hypothetical protein
MATHDAFLDSCAFAFCMWSLYGARVFTSCTYEYYCPRLLFGVRQAATVSRSLVRICMTVGCSDPCS